MQKPVTPYSLWNKEICRLQGPGHCSFPQLLGASPEPLTHEQVESAHAHPAQLRRHFWNCSKSPLLSYHPIHTSKVKLTKKSKESKPIFPTYWLMLKMLSLEHTFIVRIQRKSYAFELRDTRWTLASDHSQVQSSMEVVLGSPPFGGRDRAGERQCVMFEIHSGAPLPV